MITKTGPTLLHLRSPQMDDSEYIKILEDKVAQLEAELDSIHHGLSRMCINADKNAVVVRAAPPYNVEMLNPKS